MRKEVKIDVEFLALCPQLTPEERSLLEASIEAEGCRDPLVVWKEEGVLLDGHNRKAICERFQKPYEVVEISLPSRAAAVEWVIANQLGRRNLTDEQKGYLRGKRYREEKKVDSFKGNQHTKPAGSHSDHQQKTSEKLAKEYGVSPKTIVRDAKFSAAVDKFEEVGGKDAKDEILSGASRATKKEVIAAAEAPASDLQSLLASTNNSVNRALAQLSAKPEPPPRKIGETFTNAVKGLSQRISGIRDQYGSVEAMFKSKEWKGSDVYMTAEFFHEVVLALAKLDKEMQDYVKKHPSHKA